MLNQAIKLYMIPGASTDRRMYMPQLERFPTMEVPEWLPPQDLHESLESYARRLSAKIDTSEPFVVGGVSLGGMIAQEMALILKPKAVILISSCSSYKNIAMKWRLSGKLTSILPDSIIKSLSDGLAKAMQLTHVKRKNIYAIMLREMNPHLVRWQSGAATRWTLKSTLSMPVYHIHGDKDNVIPIKNITPNKVVPGGTHLINVTHEHEVNDFIAECLDYLSNA